MSIDIGELIRTSGLPASTLHVWERHGLIEPTDRVGGRRQFADDVLDRLAEIVLLQRSGFQLDEIAELLRPGAFDDGKQALQEKLDDLVMRRRHLDEAIEGLRHALNCPAPSPLRCDGFRQHLESVLPVSERSDHTGSPPNRGL